MMDMPTPTMLNRSCAKTEKNQHNPHVAFGRLAVSLVLRATKFPPEARQQSNDKHKDVSPHSNPDHDDGRYHSFGSTN